MNQRDLPIKPRKLTAKMAKAAILVAEDELTDPKIIEKVNISLRTLCWWKTLPEFEVARREAVEAIAKKILSHGVARIDRRMARLNKTWLELQQIIAARGDKAKDLASDLFGVAGADTGHIVMQTKKIGTGYDAETVREYSIDTGVLAELRAIEMQAAKEAGQWVEKRDMTSLGKSISPDIDLRKLAEEDLAALEEILTKAENEDAAKPSESSG